ncbi:hypothetical protein BROC_02154 [Candidatus Brocadiaceae bacterium]|nr:hypothetical protein BROC_02154 [Candidatus Brocadiaceae bacterium]
MAKFTIALVGSVLIAALIGAISPVLGVAISIISVIVILIAALMVPGVGLFAGLGFFFLELIFAPLMGGNPNVSGIERAVGGAMKMIAVSLALGIIAHVAVILVILL